MKVDVIYGTILFSDDNVAVIKEVDKEEFVEGETEDECMEMAEWNASFYKGDWLIPSLYKGAILWDTVEDDLC